jgi:hypothetical protein
LRFYEKTEVPFLPSDETEAELTELLSTINTDIRTDWTLDSTTTKATLVTA